MNNLFEDIDLSVKKNYQLVNKVVVLFCLVTFLVLPPFVSADDLFSGLNMTNDLSINGDSQSGDSANQIVAKLAGYEITGEGKVVSHNYFERDLDAPPFFNFLSEETNTITGFSMVNGGTCYGISMVAIRYFQWFILPSLLDDEALEEVRGKKLFGFGKPKSKRPLPAYAKRIGKDFDLPSWMFEWPEGSQAQRTKRIAPYRFRAFLNKNKTLAKKIEKALKSDEVNSQSKRLNSDVAKEHAIRMFDNQKGLMRKGAQLYEMISRKTHDYGNSDSKVFKAVFGRCAFDTIKKNIDNDKLGCSEIGFWGSKLKPMWGHSVVAFKITEFEAENSKTSEKVKAFKVHIYDNNDPFNTSDNVFWYFNDVQKFAPAEQYADFYDGDSPLKPKGKEFLNAIQMGPSTETFSLNFESNLMNRFSHVFEKVEVKN